MFGENIFVVDESKRVFLNGYEIEKVLNVEIKNINPLENPEVTITVAVDEIDVKYKGLLKYFT